VRRKRDEEECDEGRAMRGRATEVVERRAMATKSGAGIELVLSGEEEGRR
jgi:hypothetical protein